jgi:putative glutamine amidotransferase
MRILISTRDFRIPPTNFLYDCLERSWYSFLDNHQLIPVSNYGVVPEFEYDCLVLSGGQDSIARHLTENKLFYHAMQNRKPVLGVCHGAFAINDLTGGVNKVISKEYIEKHDQTNHKVKMVTGEEYEVCSYHGQCVTSLGEHMIPVAHDEDGHIEAFKHVALPIYGIVWHPERMKHPIVPREVSELLGKPYQYGTETTE